MVDIVKEQFVDEIDFPYWILSHWAPEGLL